MAKWWFMMFGVLIVTLCDSDEIYVSTYCDRESQSSNQRSYGKIKELKMDFNKKFSWLLTQFWCIGFLGTLPVCVLEKDGIFLQQAIFLLAHVLVMKESEFQRRAFLPMSSFLDPVRQLSETLRGDTSISHLYPIFFFSFPIILVTYMYLSKEGLIFFNTGGERQSRQGELRLEVGGKYGRTDLGCSIFTNIQYNEQRLDWWTEN